MSLVLSLRARRCRENIHHLPVCFEQQLGLLHLLCVVSDDRDTQSMFLLPKPCGGVQDAFAGVGRSPSFLRASLRYHV